MKKTSHIRAFRRSLAESRGFTLIITISLLVLLTLVAIGILSLSTVTLRSSAQGNAMSLARSNAKLALMLAIADLQKTMGPDKAISATSEILGANPAKPNLMGAWESWDANPSSTTLNYASEKTTRFRRWLVSDADPLATSARNYATAGAVNNPITLVGEGSLGAGAVDADRVRAGLVPISRNGIREGQFAWHVADESVKARVNSYRDPAQNTSLAQRRALLTGHRPEPRLVTSRDGTMLDYLPSDQTAQTLTTARAAEGKLVDLSQIDLFSANRQTGKFRHVVTPYSMGLLTDVRNGGLKQDLTSLMEMATMPTEYNGRRLYQSTHNITGVSDPFWSTLQSYYTVYRDVTAPDAAPTYYRPPLEAVSPGTLTAPRRFYPAPVIAKVEILFTYVTRDSHANWVGSLLNVSQEHRRMGHLLYTPLVTLHNPYNISIQFDEMQVVIRNVPVAFNFYVNNQPQSAGLVPINEMFVNNGQKGEKSFALNIANWTSPSSRDSTPMTLRPGQTVVCGPFLSPSASFSNTQGTPIFDWQNNLTGVDQFGNVTNPVPGRPGFTGKAVGFDIDWITPTHAPYNNPGQATDNNMGVLGLRDNDLVHIEYAVRQPSRGQNDRFDVQATITSRGRQMAYGGLTFVYNDASTLGRYFNTVHRFPLSGAFPASEAYHSNTTPISAQGNAKSFALFSAYARTTNGGVFETNSRNQTAGALNVQRDGRLAGKPMMHHNPARSVVLMDYRTEVPGMQSHELNFVPLPGHVDDVFEIDAANRNNVLAGNTTQRGIKSGSYLELPTGPMQTIADFRRSNALTSPYLPNFVQPVANSSVSPLMSTTRVSETGLTSYALLDHSVLANYALYDRFYFSTIAPVGSKTATNVLNDFLGNRAPLLTQSFAPYVPSGKTTTTIATELLNAGRPAANAYRLAAEYQMVKGAFNVNSTSVAAWKAILGSMRNTPVPVMWSRSGTLENRNTAYTPVTPMTLTNGGVATDAAVNSAQTDNARTNQWNGFRDLTDAQLDTLAQRIVEQVRLRGPFLSMHEFVNRQIGANSNLTRMGALQAALETSQVNNAVFATQVPITAANVSDVNLYRNRTVEANVGNPAEGAPGWITQGDLMRIIEPLATVRSDTFVIRVCGEALNANGGVSARAYAEAVVQRMPEYVNPIDRPSVNVYTAANASPLNKAFGRRLQVVSFRWLSQQEV